MREFILRLEDDDIIWRIMDRHFLTGSEMRNLLLLYLYYLINESSNPLVCQYFKRAMSEFNRNGDNIETETLENMFQL